MAETHRAPSRTRGFLFADLRGYTDFVEAHGDHAAAELLNTYRRLVREQVAAFDGAEIKTEGDSFYVVFDSASAAVDCGLAIVAAAARASSVDPARAIRVGLGVHAGETVETDEGYVGSAVNIASRVCAMAGPNQLLVTDIVRALTRTFLDVAFVPIGARPLKGVAEPIPLYRVDPAGMRAAPAATKRHRSVPRAGAALAVVAIALVVLVAGAAMLRGGAPGLVPSAAPGQSFIAVTSVQPTGQSTATPAPPSQSPSAASPTAGATPTPVPAATMSAADADLYTRIPSKLLAAPSTCAPTPIADRLTGVVASIRCDLALGGGVERVWYEKLNSTSMLTERWKQATYANGVGPGDCAKQARAYGPWKLAEQMSGQLVCYPVGTVSWLLWTYDGPTIVARAEQPSGSAARLYEWWYTLGRLLR